MLSVFVTEWMKLKRSPLIWIPICWFLFSKVLPDNPMFFIPYSVYLFNSHGGMGCILAFIATAYLFSQEHQNRTVSQFLSYPQGRAQMYFGKMFVSMSMFLLYLCQLLISTYVTVREVHSAIIFLLLAPLAVLVGLIIRNLFVGLLAQVALGWFINGQLDKIQNKTLYISRYHDSQGLMKDFDLSKIKMILYEYFSGTPLNMTYTIGFIVVSLLSVMLIYVFSKRDVVSG